MLHSSLWDLHSFTLHIALPSRISSMIDFTTSNHPNEHLSFWAPARSSLVWWCGTCPGWAAIMAPVVRTRWTGHPWGETQGGHENQLGIDLLGVRWSPFRVGGTFRQRFQIPPFKVFRPSKPLPNKFSRGTDLEPLRSRITLRQPRRQAPPQLVQVDSPRRDFLCAPGN